LEDTRLRACAGPLRPSLSVTSTVQR